MVVNEFTRVRYQIKHFYFYPFVLKIPHTTLQVSFKGLGAERSNLKTPHTTSYSLSASGLRVLFPCSTLGDRDIPLTFRCVPPLVRCVPPLVRCVPPLVRCVPPLGRCVPPLGRCVPLLGRCVPPLVRCVATPGSVFIFAVSFVPFSGRCFIFTVSLVPSPGSVFIFTVSFVPSSGSTFIFTIGNHPVDASKVTTPDSKQKPGVAFNSLFQRAIIYSTMQSKSEIRPEKIVYRYYF
jgi:hypothetical protein